MTGIQRSQPMKDLADRTLRDWAQAAEENPVLKARVKVLEASAGNADKKLREIVQYAKGNAKAAKIKDDEMTWEAHAREVERASKMLRAALQPKAGS